VSGPFRLDHVAVAVASMADTTRFIVGELGGEPVDGGPGFGFRGAQWRFAGGGRLEVIEPVGARDGFLHRFVDARGPGVHHVTFKVPDLNAAIAKARAHGTTIAAVYDSNPSWKEGFLHPKSAMGIVVQFAESHPELGQGEWSADFPFPESPPAKSPPATLLGLELTARSRARAIAQWAELLGGDIEEEAEERVVFRWDESPLRISVLVDERSSEGARRIELSCERALELPHGAHPVIGAEFVNVLKPHPRH